ncbi:MAG: hypothetical protein ACUVUE_08230, partial [Candidatus Bathycorpusculaceae bacterium]
LEFNLGSAALDLGRLAKLRLLAFRRGIWFRVLSRLDRSLLDLVLKVAKRVRSQKLASAVCSIVKKLEDALEGRVARWMREFGAPLAEELSRIAQGWGYSRACEWAEDSGFIRYLAVMGLNGHPWGGRSRSV